MKTILIAEDDPIFLQLLTTSLKKHADQFAVVTAPNGNVAVDILKKSKISLLLTDIQMPEMDGLQLLAHMVEHYPLVPCFVMTAYETPELGERLPKDIRAFFRKPFPPGTLGPLITRALDKEPSTTSGNITGISVSSFMMMVEMEKKTCLLEVRLPDNRKGVFFFEKGVLYNAVASGGLKGEEAALLFVTQKKARFAFLPMPEKKIVKQDPLKLADLIDRAQEVEPEEKPPAEPKPEKKGLHLRGNFTGIGNEGGTMEVVNLSIPALRMRLAMKPEFSVGDRLKINFYLDDQRGSLVSKDVTVSDIDNDLVTVDFLSREHYDRLGPYLHFNGFEEKNW